MGTDVLSQLPKKDILWVTCTSDNGVVYYVTSDRQRTTYKLWKKVLGGVQKLMTSSSPLAFYKRYLK